MQNQQAALAFEKCVIRLLNARFGFACAATQQTHDKGMDFVGAWPQVKNLSVIGQCKYERKTLAVNHVRAFLGTMNTFAAQFGILVCASEFSLQAVQLAMTYAMPLALCKVQQEHHTNTWVMRQFLMNQAARNVTAPELIVYERQGQVHMAVRNGASGNVEPMLPTKE